MIKGTTNTSRRRRSSNNIRASSLILSVALLVVQLLTSVDSFASFHNSAIANVNSRTSSPSHSKSHRRSSTFSPSVAAGSNSNRPPAVRPSTTSTNMSSSSQTDPNLPERAFAKIGSTTSTVVALTFFLILSYERDAYMIAFFLGSILNGIASKVLKRMLNQDRPEDGYRIEGESGKEKPSDKGMPSSHAMSLGFIGIYTSIGLWDYMSASLGMLGVAYSILWSYVAVSLIYRVKSNLHTPSQVYVGLTFGVFDGIMWNSLAHGTNPILPSVNVMEIITDWILPESGVMPVYYLVVPAAVGAAVVGSFERKIGRWLKKRKEKKVD